MDLTFNFSRLNHSLIGILMMLVVSFSSAQTDEFRHYDSLFNESLSFDLDEADSYLQKQRKLYSTRKEKVDFWLNSMMLNYKRNKFEAALKNGKTAKKFLKKSDDRRYGTYLKIQSLIKWKKGDYQGANQLLKQGLKEGSVEGAIVRTHLHNLIINNYISLEQYDSALVVSRAVLNELNGKIALKEKNSIGYKNLYQTNLYSMGNIFYYQTAYDSSLYYYQEAYSFDSSDPVWATNCLMGIADVLTLKGDYKEAEKKYIQILKSLENQPEGISLAHAYFNYATNFKEQENTEEAYTFYRKAERLSQDLNYDLILGMSLQEIGEAFFEMEQLDSAQHYVERSIPILERIRNARGLCFTYCTLSRIQSKNGNRQASFLAVQKAEEWMEQLNTLDSRAIVLTTYYEFYSQYGPAESALYYLKASNEVNDSIQGIEVQKSLNRLIVTHEVELKGKENELLRVEVSRKNAEVKRKEAEKRFWQIVLFSTAALLILVIVIGANVLKIRRQKLKVKEEKLLHSDQIKTLLMHKLDDADQAVKNAEQVISDLKDQQSNSLKDKQSPELLIESLRQEKDWVAFMIEFELIYTQFFSELKKVSSSDFTSRERRLLAMIKLGLTNQEIADQVFISIDSVKKSKNRLFKKINLPNKKLKPTDFIRNIE